MLEMDFPLSLYISVSPPLITAHLKKPDTKGAFSLGEKQNPAGCPFRHSMCLGLDGIKKYSLDKVESQGGLDDSAPVPESITHSSGKE
jgi:hypothetical protein